MRSTQTDAPAPGRRAPAPGVVVRAPATGELHLLAGSTQAPVRLTAGVPLLCGVDGRDGPAVRPYAGPWDEHRACRACLAAARGEPPQPPATAQVLPGGEPTGPSGPVPSRLPAEHAGRPVLWQGWKPAPYLTHIPQHCPECGDPGPGLLATGRAGQPPPARYIAFRCPACGHERAHAVRNDATLALIWAQRGR